MARALWRKSFIIGFLCMVAVIMIIFFHAQQRLYGNYTTLNVTKHGKERSSNSSAPATKQEQAKYLDLRPIGSEVQLIPEMKSRSAILEWVDGEFKSKLGYSCPVFPGSQGWFVILYDPYSGRSASRVIVYLQRPENPTDANPWKLSYSGGMEIETDGKTSIDGVYIEKDGRTLVFITRKGKELGRLCLPDKPR